MSTTSEEIKNVHGSHHMEEEIPLSRQMTLQISPEQYERLFFQPTPARGDLAKRVGNPTLAGLMGFLVPFQSLVLALLQLSDASASSLGAQVGIFYFFGFIILLAGVAEFLLGNTYPMSIFIVFGAHWMQVGYNNDPHVGLVNAFTTAEIPGALAPAWNSGNGMYSISMMCICIIFFIGSLRTNVPFSLCLFTLIPLFAIFAAAQFHIGAHPTAEGVAYGLYLFKVAGGFGLVSVLCGWYLALIQVCAAVGIPCPLPVGDLSQRLFKDTQAAREEAAAAGGGSGVAKPHHA